MLSAQGAPEIPPGGSLCNLLKSRTVHTHAHTLRPDEDGERRRKMSN